MQMSSIDDPRSGLSPFLKEQTRGAHREAERVFVRTVKEGGPVKGPTHLMCPNVALVAWRTCEAQTQMDNACEKRCDTIASPLATEIAAFVAISDAARSSALAMPPLPQGHALRDEEEIAGAVCAVCGSVRGAAALARGWGTGSSSGFAALHAASATLEQRRPILHEVLDAFGRAHADRAERAFADARDGVASLRESRPASRAAGLAR